MYAQITTIQVPLNQMTQLRKVIESKYLPVVRTRPGFNAGYLLEQVDDVDNAQLVLFWDDQESVENFTRTGLLQASLTALAMEVPGLHVRREGFIVSSAVRAVRAAEAFA